MYKKIIKQQRQSLDRLTRLQEERLKKLYLRALNDGVAKDLATEEQIIRLFNTIRNEIVGASAYASRLGVDGNQAYINKLLEKSGIEASANYHLMFKAIQEDVLKSFIQSNVYQDNKSLSDRIWRISEESTDTIQQVIEDGLIAKRSAIDISKDLEEFLRPERDRKWKIKEVYPSYEGEATIYYDAFRLARTTINHVYQTATVKSSVLNPFTKGIRWLTSNNHEKVCELCKERADTDQYGLGVGIFPVDKVPLDHPNGMCTLETIMIHDLESQANILARWVKGEENKMLDTWYNEYGKDMIGGL